MYTDTLLPIDLNHDSSWHKALPTAVEYAKAFGAKLHVLTVVPDFGMAIVGSYFPEGFETKAREEANQRLHQFVKDHVPPELSVQHIVAEGTTYKEILRVADELQVDLIVMAAHRPELQDYFLGPTPERVVRHATRSVLVVRD